jgi:hypothetical protein
MARDAEARETGTECLPVGRGRDGRSTGSTQHDRRGLGGNRSRGRAPRRHLDCRSRDDRLDRSGLHDRGRSRRSDDRLRRRGGGCGRRRGATAWEQRQRIDVPLRIARRSHSEVDVRVGVFDYAARPNRSDHGALTEACAARDRDRPEVDKRQRVTRGRLDRHRLSARRHGACKGDDARSRCEHRPPGRRAEVDPAVLSRRVRMCAVEREGSQHRPVDGPRPRLRNRHRQRTGADDHQNHGSPHDLLLVARFENDVDGSKADRSLSILATKYDGRARCAKPRSGGRRPLRPVGAQARRPRGPPPLRTQSRPRRPSSQAPARA